MNTLWEVDDINGLVQEFENFLKRRMGVGRLSQVRKMTTAEGACLADTTGQTVRKLVEMLTHMLRSAILEDHRADKTARMSDGKARDLIGWIRRTAGIESLAR